MKKATSPVLKIASAQEMRDLGDSIKLSNENLEGLFQSSIRIKHVYDIQKSIEYYVKIGYTYTLGLGNRITSLTKAEKELFEKAGYKVRNDEKDKRDGEQNWIFDWTPSK